MKFEIKSYWTGGLLFSVETDSLKLAVEAAVKSDADLSGAVLRDADLSDADLSGAVLRDADLSGAVLRDADLSGADLRGADLRDADLSGADLRDADLSGADLRDADLSGAKGVTPQVLQIIGTRHALMVREYGKIQIGCMVETPAWWDEHREAVGRKEGYSNEQVAEYGEHIASAKKFMERYSLMEEPKKEELTTQ